MNWDGKNVTGTINPGPDAIQVGSVALDVTNWTVRIEADGKDQSGKAVHISAEGKIDDPSSAHRKLSGTGTQGTTKGDLRLSRDSCERDAILPTTSCLHCIVLCCTGSIAAILFRNVRQHQASEGAGNCHENRLGDSKCVFLYRRSGWNGPCDELG